MIEIQKYTANTQNDNSKIEGFLTRIELGKGFDYYINEDTTWHQSNCRKFVHLVHEETIKKV